MPQKDERAQTGLKHEEELSFLREAIIKTAGVSHLEHVSNAERAAYLNPQGFFEAGRS